MSTAHVTDIATAPQLDAAALETTLIQGDLARLTPAQRVAYYSKVCESVGLNPLTKPFEYIQLNGRLRLYALKDCTEQLRKIHGVSLIIVSREVVEDCYVVTARATDRSGRTDESVGAVSIGGLKGEARSNAMMKAETKAKRRVTLSICGLGMLDETETDSIPGARVVDSGPPMRPVDVSDTEEDRARFQSAMEDESRNGEAAGSGSAGGEMADARAASPPPSSEAKPPRANTIKHDGKPATAAQVTMLHVLKGKIGGLTEDAYRKQLAAFRDQQGKSITTSKDLSYAQIANLISRYEAQIARQQGKLAAMEAEAEANVAAIGGAAERPTGEEMATLYAEKCINDDDRSLFLAQLGYASESEVKPDELLDVRTCLLSWGESTFEASRQKFLAKYRALGRRP